jgi:hypothetical protein
VDGKAQKEVTQMMPAFAPNRTLDFRINNFRAKLNPIC